MLPNSSSIPLQCDFAAPPIRRLNQGVAVIWFSQYIYGSDTVQILTLALRDLHDSSLAHGTLQLRVNQPGTSLLMYEEHVASCYLS